MIIFRIIRNLLRMTLGLLWLPISIITRNLFLAVLIVAGVLIYSLFKHHTNDPSVPSLPKDLPATQGSMIQGAAQKAPRVVIDPIMKREDGNSAFASDLYASMTPLEQAYYSQLFFWAMTNLPDGRTHQWSNGNTDGSITPTRSYKNSAGDTCRDFTEILKVHTVEQTLSGVACPHENGSWCKLKLNATPACGLGHKAGMFDSLKSLF